MLPSRKNNFDILRLLFATFVVISHSFWINGKYDSEILNRATGGQIDLGALGVKGFFVISGFLVFRSLERSRNWLDFMAKRLLRIYPALAVMSVFIMLLAPLAYRGNGILSERSYWAFPAKVLSLFQFLIYIRGVFSGHPRQEVNMSLWTLCYEVSCYMLLSILFFIKSKRLRYYLLAAAFLAAWYLSSFRHFWLNGRVFSHLNMFSYYFWDLACFFCAGAWLSHFDFAKVRWRLPVIFIALLGCVVSLYLHNFYIFKYPLLAVAVLFVATSQQGLFSGVGARFGDISYGVYIYGWFIQQMLWELFRLDVWPLTFVSLPIIYLLGWLSWILVERPCLKLKNRL